MSALNADAPENVCEPHRTRSTATSSAPEHICAHAHLDAHVCADLAHARIADALLHVGICTDMDTRAYASEYYIDERVTSMALQLESVAHAHAVNGRIVTTRTRTRVRIWAAHQHTRYHRIRISEDCMHLVGAIL